MAMMEDKSVIIDTNILLYLNTDFTGISEKVYAKYAELKYADFSFYVSEQIIREFIVAKFNLQKIKNQIDFPQLFSDLEFIKSHFNIIFPGIVCTEVLFNLLRKYELTGKKIHDEYYSDMYCQ